MQNRKTFVHKFTYRTYAYNAYNLPGFRQPPNQLWLVPDRAIF